MEKVSRRFVIGLHGCDDSTVFEMNLTTEQETFLKEVAAVAKETHTYRCMPIMTVEQKPVPEQNQESERKENFND